MDMKFLIRAKNLVNIYENFIYIYEKNHTERYVSWRCRAVRVSDRPLKDVP